MAALRNIGICHISVYVDVHRYIVWQRSARARERAALSSLSLSLSLSLALQHYAVCCTYRPTFIVQGVGGGPVVPMLTEYYRHGQRQTQPVVPESGPVFCFVCISDSSALTPLVCNCACDVRCCLTLRERERERGREEGESV